VRRKLDSFNYLLDRLSRAVIPGHDDYGYYAQRGIETAGPKALLGVALWTSEAVSGVAAARTAPVLRTPSVG
jgi:hypothetical protein